MKKLLTSVAMVLLLAGCAKEYDDSAIKTRLDAIETKLIELESNIQAIQSAIGEGVFVAKVQEYADPDTQKTIGVTVTYTNGDVKYFAISPKTDYAGPVLGVITNGAGKLVWAIDGTAIKDDNGNEVPVNKTPAFSIDDDGNLWVSIDGGAPVNLGPVTSGGATLEDGIFTDIKVEADKIVLTLSDNSKVNIPFAEAFKLNIEKTEYSFSKLEAIDIPYTVSAKTANTVVGVAGYSPKDFIVAVADDKITVTPLNMSAAGILLAYADSKIGLTSLVNITIEGENVEVVDKPYSAEIDYMAEGEEAVVTANVVSNVEFDVKPVDAWIKLVSVKATAYVLTFQLEDNTTGATRTGKVNITKKGTDTVIQTITIGQAAAEVGGAKNLSKKGAANSYIVTAPGEYKFWTVKGNSGDVIADIAKADIIWETYNNTETVAVNSVIATVAYASDYITFTTPETLKPGNALIAAKDANDVILWSWHIWIPETDIVTASFDNMFGADAMDRNLGALTAAVGSATDVEVASSCGLLYQWGRKDPLSGAGDMANKLALTMSHEREEASGVQITIAESIAHPTMFAYNSATANEENDWKGLNWCSEDNNSAWDNAGAKGLYDPCPPGYRVPVFNSALPAWMADNWVSDQAHYWYKLGDAIFPHAGYLDDCSGSLSHAYDRSALWSATASSDDKASCSDVRATFSPTSKYKSRGNSVRCVVDGTAPVTPPSDPGDNPGGNPGSATDLSATASANSYIVTAAGDYKFKTVKGNGSDSVGEVAKAEVLWETNYSDEAAPAAGAIISAVSFADAYITLTATGTPGGALIVAKDSGDAILWTWFIWIPKTEIGLIDDAALYGKKIMDRNLGAGDKATTAAAGRDTYGMYYQWGRITPLPGKMKVAAEFAVVDGPKSTAFAIANPTAFIKVAESNDGGNWNEEDLANLWEEGGNKAIYDPCPPGYKVPSYNDATGLWINANDGWTYNWDANNFAYGDSVFPLAGWYSSSASVGYEGERSIILSATAHSTPRARLKIIRKDKDGFYYGNYFKQEAASVRCVVE